ncbi:MAG: DUF4838 domain-containing protein [Clostridia bacterium]|nr:DUF4838 domain-containing protein [Clostridia bacterium]
MKRILSVLLILSLCCSFSLPDFAKDGGVSLDGSWSILVSSEPTSYEVFAAQKLSSELSAVFGTKIPIVSSADNKYIAVGSASQTDVSKVAVNGYRIQVIDGNIHIGGTGERGLQAAAYRFLEEFCGRKVYAYNCIELPGAVSITVPVDTDLVYEPYFEYTDTDWLSPWDTEYSLSNGLNGDPHRDIPDEAGGAVRYLGGFCHTMGEICETEAHAESDPEHLALHNGERTTDQPCLTNPEVLKTAIANVLDILKQRYDPRASVQIVSVTQNDNQNYCECDSCKAFEATYGGVQSATMINFVNQIADAVKEAGYDNVAIDTFAYQYTRKAPEGIVPRDNVIVRLCTIECCFCHTLDDTDCERNKELMKDLEEWSKICRRIYVWDYTTNYANTCVVFPDFGVIQRNIQIFYEHNVKGVYEEGNYYIRNCDAEFGELRAYLISKCLQNPYCDYDAEMKGFLNAYYGPGGEDVAEIIDIYLNNTGAHLSIYENPRSSLSLTDEQITEIDSLWSHSKSVTNGEQLEHIIRSELSWRFW